MLSQFVTASLIIVVISAIIVVSVVSGSVTTTPTINLPPLNFGLASLRPHLTHEQLNLHYNAHQAGYVTFLKSWLESSTGETALAVKNLWSRYQDQVRAAEVQFIQNAGASQLGDTTREVFNVKLNKMNQSFITFLVNDDNNGNYYNNKLPEGSKHRNFAGQVYNHALYFSSMTDEPIHLEDYMASYRATSPLAAAIANQFESAEKFAAAFENKAVSHFGSGWIWLGVLKKRGGGGGGGIAAGTPPLRGEKRTLFIVDTHDGQVFYDKIRTMKKLPETDVEFDLDAGDEVEPLLVCDVWEHAYYVDYRQKRADYVKGWLKVVDWARIDARFSSSPLNIEVRPHRLDDKERGKRMFLKKNGEEKAFTEANDAYPHFL